MSGVNTLVNVCGGAEPWGIIWETARREGFEKPQAQVREETRYKVRQTAQSIGLTLAAAASISNCWIQKVYATEKAPTTNRGKPPKKNSNLPKNKGSSPKQDDQQPNGDGVRPKTDAADHEFINHVVDRVKAALDPTVDANWRKLPTDQRERLLQHNGIDKSLLKEIQIQTYPDTMSFQETVEHYIIDRYWMIHGAFQKLESSQSSDRGNSQSDVHSHSSEAPGSSVHIPSAAQRDADSAPVQTSPLPQTRPPAQTQPPAGAPTRPRHMPTPSQMAQKSLVARHGVGSGPGSGARLINGPDPAHRPLAVDAGHNSPLQIFPDPRDHVPLNCDPSDGHRCPLQLPPHLAREMEQPSESVEPPSGLSHGPSPSQAENHASSHPLIQQPPSIGKWAHLEQLLANARADREDTGDRNATGSPRQQLGGLPETEAASGRSDQTVTMATAGPSRTGAVSLGTSRATAVDGSWSSTSTTLSSRPRFYMYR